MKLEWLSLALINSVFSTGVKRIEHFPEVDINSGDDKLFVVYSQPKVVRRQSRDNLPDDNIAVDSENSPKFSQTKNASSADSQSEETDRVESDPGNTYLQVGEWIAQWDAPYEAWYYYNSESGVSTWSKPAELEGIEFTDPVPDILTAKQKVKAAHEAHRNKETEILEEFQPGSNTVRGERDKPHTHHNSLSLGPSSASQLNLPQTKDKGSSNIATNGYFPSKSEYVAPAQTPNYQSPTNEDSYGSPLAKPVSNYGAPAQKPPAPAGKPFYVEPACRRFGGLACFSNLQFTVENFASGLYGSNSLLLFGVGGVTALLILMYLLTISNQQDPSQKSVVDDVIILLSQPTWLSRWVTQSDMGRQFPQYLTDISNLVREAFKLSIYSF